MATAGGGGGGGRIYVRQTSFRPSGLFEELGDRTICGPADETRLCIFERGPGGKLERAEDRCVPKTRRLTSAFVPCICNGCTTCATLLASPTAH